ncbi:MAG: DivIVA domain-containing protein [Clostridia bacterium]|nr:DivIVA domain-containing protein [Clostridia bacterium]
MYTAEEIREIAFTKSFGGYKTAEVDDFVDRCADTVESLTTENEELNKKLEILANKLLEYRNEEDTIRTTLMSAQRLGDTVLREAKHKAELILEDANIKAEKAIGDLKVKEQEEQAKLDKLKLEISDFKARILDMYREHLTQVSLLPEEEKAEEPAEPEAYADAEEAVEEAAEDMAEDAVSVTESVTDEPADAVAEEVTGAVADVAEDAAEIAEDAAEEAPASKFANLQFGDDYAVEDEDDGHKGPFGRRR